MTTKNWLVRELDYDRKPLIYCSSGAFYAPPEEDVFSSQESAEEFSKKEAASNLKKSYGIYELITVVKAPTPKVDVIKL